MSDHDDLLACPKCKAELVRAADYLECSSDDCATRYPIVAGRPILINEANSLFRFADFQESEKGSVNWASQKSSLLTRLRHYVPNINNNTAGAANLRKVALNLAERESRNVLIVGAGERGVGIGALEEVAGVKLVRTDVYIGDCVDVVADAHDLPFCDKTFDGVVIQAVLEHVLDPYRCVEEIHRVPKPTGVVYAETPFLWPVHMGAYDFLRFSRSGHRRLFRWFTEVETGMAAGPATTCALAIRGAFLGMSRSRWMSGFAHYILPFFIFWIKYFDRFMLNSPHAADFAAAFYFIGERAEAPLSDNEIISHHWSCQQANN